MGDKFIKPDSETIYVVVRVVLGRDWVILKEEGGDCRGWAWGDVLCPVREVAGARGDFI